MDQLLAPGSSAAIASLRTQRASRFALLKLRIRYRTTAASTCGRSGVSWNNERSPGDLITGTVLLSCSIPLVLHRPSCDYRNHRQPRISSYLYRPSIAVFTRWAHGTAGTTLISACCITPCNSSPDPLRREAQAYHPCTPRFNWRLDLTPLEVKTPSLQNDDAICSGVHRILLRTRPAVRKSIRLGKAARRKAAAS